MPEATEGTPKTEAGQADGFPPNRILSFSAGFVLLLIMIGIALSKPDLETNYIILVVLSAAAAAFVVVVPGMFEIQIANYVKAGGALGVFAAVFFGAPKIPTPVGDETVSFTTSANATFDSQASFAVANTRALIYDRSCPPTLPALKLKPNSPIRAASRARAVENLYSVAETPLESVKRVVATDDMGNAQLVVRCE